MTWKHPVTLLRVGLGMIGLVIVFLGFDVAFGGIRTLGWMGSTNYLEIVDSTAFRIQDSHFRFLGVWLGVGIVLLRRLRTVLIVLCGVIFIGGIARFSAFDIGILLRFSVLRSLLAELILFPAVGYWL